MKAVASAVCTLLSLVLLVGADHFKVNPGTNQIIDEFNRERFFHGVNVVYKSFPYVPITDHFDAQLSFSIKDMETLQEWGLNGIRLGTMWPGVEPVKGQFNESYIDQLRWIISNAANHGIYTLMDAHQDCLSEKFCGEGIPLWATDSSGPLAFPLPLQLTPFHLDSHGVPSHADCMKHAWGEYQFTEAAATAYQALYQNEDGLADDFGAFWAKVAQEFKNSSSVIGFELLNEPFAGDLYSDPLLMYPGVADKRNLAPFYDKLQSYISQSDPDRIIFFESVTWDDEFGSKIFDTGFEAVPGGEAFANTSVYAFHFYNPPNIGKETSYLAERVADAKRLRCAPFITEFSLSDDSAKVQTSMADFDAQRLSWLAWEYKAFAGSLPNGTCTGCGRGPWFVNGTLDMDIVRSLVRTYPQAVAGTTESIRFDPVSSAFDLVFKPSAQSIGHPTEIYLNEGMHYPHGYTVAISPSSAASWKSDHNRVLVSTVDASASSITVSITAKLPSQN